MKWPDLKINPINLWNSPKMFIEKDILDKIEDEIFRYYIRFNGKIPDNVYLGRKEQSEVSSLLCNSLSCKTKLSINIIPVNKDTYLKVG